MGDTDSLDWFNTEMRKKFPDWDQKLVAARKRFHEEGGLSGFVVTDITDIILRHRTPVRLREDCQ